MAECMPRSPHTGACHGAWLLGNWHRPGLLGTARSSCRQRSSRRQSCTQVTPEKMAAHGSHVAEELKQDLHAAGGLGGRRGSSEQGRPAWRAGQLSVARRLLNGSRTPPTAAIGSSREQQRWQAAAAAERRSGGRKPGSHSLMSGPPSSSSLKVSGSSSDSSLSSLCTQQTEQRHDGTVSREGGTAYGVGAWQLLPCGGKLGLGGWHRPWQRAAAATIQWEQATLAVSMLENGNNRASAMHCPS